MLRGAGEGRLLVLNNQSSVSRLVALKPRQVLLAEQQKRLKMPKTTVLEDDHKLALLHSVVKYMSNKGFKKSLKKFIKEAQVEDGAWEANSFDLEEIYCKYLENCKNGNTNTQDLREPEKSAEGTMLKDAGDKGASLDAVNKKKMKKNDKNGDITKSSVSEVISDNAVEELKEKKKKKKKKNAAGDEETPVEDDGKNTNNANEENNKDDVTELTSKKKKKKNKLTSESCEENGTNEVSLPAVSEKQVVPKEVADVAEITADQNNSEPKEKKKKKKKKVSGKPLDNGVELVNKEQSQDDLGNGTDEKSKKRKRSTSDESVDKQVEEVVTEDSKRRKTEAVNAQQTEVKIVGGESKVDFKSPNPSDEKKTVKKQQNGSIEPKTVNAFQRVKVDAVKFADERLTDNSYWAKDGAETGYGAKAQEILGQVKGRDFRHEKTKKKRGSYRGGQIDLQSHSVKFNYSDEE